VVGAHLRVLECQLDNCTLLQQQEISTFVDCDVCLYDVQNPFGKVTGGFVTLNGPLIKVKAVTSVYGTQLCIEGAQFQLTSASFTWSKPNEFAKPNFDLVVHRSPDLESLGSLEEGIDVWCLQMREEVVKPRLTLPGRSRSVEVTLMDGLILIPDGSREGVFRRIGVWVTDHRSVVGDGQHPFRHAERQHVTII
jgi:hypothetical protein